MYDLSGLTLKQMTECGAALRRLGDGAGSMEAAADRVVRFFHDHFGADDERACVLARCYKTHPYADLEPEQQEFVRGVLGAEPPSAAVRCLTLLATAGERAEWNSRHRSIGHSAIPLPSAQMIERFPMVARLVDQLGMEVRTLIQPDPLLFLDLQQRSFNIFYVPEALGSPYIPAQENFVIPFGVKSVLGFGGILPTGDLFAIILFARVHVPPNTAELFKPLALSVKLALLPFAAGPTFDFGSDSPRAEADFLENR